MLAYSKNTGKDLLIPYDGDQILSIDLKNREIQYNGIFSKIVLLICVFIRDNPYFYFLYFII